MFNWYLDKVVVSAVALFCCTPSDVKMYEVVFVKMLSADDIACTSIVGTHRWASERKRKHFKIATSFK